MEFVTIALGVWLCVGILPGVLLGLLLRKNINNPAPPDVLNLVQGRIEQWVAEERLAPVVAATLYALIAADRAALQSPSPPEPQQLTPVATETPPTAEPLPAPVPPPAPPPVPVAPPPARRMPVPFVRATTTDAYPNPTPLLATGGQVAAVTPPRQRQQWASALLALGTRRTLLYLGTFLLMLSGLTLVVFNWASFAPPIQMTILAGITGAIWAGGGWMRGRPDLERAGSNLQTVAALLVPVVLFAFTRPGLLDLAPRMGWLFTAALSLPIYSFAAFRSHNRFYSVAASVAGINILLAAWESTALTSLPAALLVVQIGYLLAGLRMRTGSRPDLAFGLYWTAHITAPVALLAGMLVSLTLPLDAHLGALTLGVGAIFYVLAAWQEDRPWWAWTAVALVPLGSYELLRTLPGISVWALHPTALAALSVGALVAALWLRPIRPHLWQAPFVVAPLLGCAALIHAVNAAHDARLILPLLMLGGIVLLRAARQGRLDALPVAAAHLDLTGFTITTVLLPAWIATLALLADPPVAIIWLLLQALTLPAFLAAYWWPGRLRAAYSLVLEGVGSLLLLGSTLLLVIDPTYWLPAAIMLTLSTSLQALLRRHMAWTALALGSAGLIGLAIVERANGGAEALLWLGWGYTTAYALLATFLRMRSWTEWVRPALVWALVIGTFTALFGGTLIFIDGATITSSLILVLLGGLLIWLSSPWQQPLLGYPATLLLAGGILSAAPEGFFIAWQPGALLSYVILALALSFGAVSLTLRSRAPAFALPYTSAAFILLLLAPFQALNSAVHLTATWAALAIIYAVATERYRKPWLILASWITLALAGTQAFLWLQPTADPVQASLILVLFAFIQGVSALLFRRRFAASDMRMLAVATDVALLLSSAGALAVAFPTPIILAWTAFLLLALFTVLAVLEQRVLLAWLTLPLIGLGLTGLQNAYLLDLEPRLFAATLVAIGLYLVGWLCALPRLPALNLLSQPLRFPPLVIGLATGFWLIGLRAFWSSEQALSMALALWAILWALGGLRERWPWMAFPALSSANLAVLVLVEPLGGDVSASEILLSSVAFGLACLESMIAVLVRRTASAWAKIGWPCYAAAGLVGFLALGIASDSSGLFATILFGTMLLLAVLGTFERHELGIWAALLFGVTAMLALGDAYELRGGWVVAWIPLGLLLFSGAGWGLERLGFVFWRRPSTLGTAIIGGLLILMPFVSFEVFRGNAALALAVACVNLGILWATVAVRLHTLALGYGAGGMFVAAVLAWFFDQGMTNAQWYVIPAGLYLLVVAASLRYFQQQGRLAQVVELMAALLILGTSMTQALRIPGGPGYELLLFGEAFAMIAYGALLRLRVPFITGVGFFVAASSWIAVEVSRGFNQWVLLGIFGLLMIATYVVLERHQERLVRMGRTWATTLRSWA
jgi:hypothetical protein